METNGTFLVRKDIADLLKVSERTVRRHEVEWGLIPARIRMTCRLIRYRRPQVFIILQRRGFI